MSKYIRRKKIPLNFVKGVVKFGHKCMLTGGRQADELNRT